MKHWEILFENACKNGNLSMLKEVMQSKDLINEMDKATYLNGLQEAAFNSHLNMVQFLYPQPDYNFDCYADDGVLIEHVVEIGNQDIFLQFFRNNMPDSMARLSFYTACSNNQLKIAKLLTSSNRNLEKEYGDSLEAASSNNYLEIVKFLINHFETKAYAYQSHLPLAIFQSVSENSDAVTNYFLYTLKVEFSESIIDTIRDKYTVSDRIEELIKKTYEVFAKRDLLFNLEKNLPIKKVGQSKKI